MQKENIRTGFSSILKLEPDYPTKIEVRMFVHLYRTGLFRDAESYFEQHLQMYPDRASIVSEYAHFLREQGRYGMLRDFLSEHVDEQGELSSESSDDICRFEKDEITLLRLCLAYAQIKTNGSLSAALQEARHALPDGLQWDENNLTELQIQILILYLNITQFVYSTSNMLSASDTQPPWNRAKDQPDWSWFKTWCLKLSKTERMWEASQVFESILLLADEKEVDIQASDACTNPLQAYKPRSPTVDPFFGEYFTSLKRLGPEQTLITSDADFLAKFASFFAYSKYCQRTCPSTAASLLDPMKEIIDFLSSSQPHSPRSRQYLQWGLQITRLFDFYEGEQVPPELESLLTAAEEIGDYRTQTDIMGEILLNNEDQIRKYRLCDRLVHPSSIRTLNRYEAVLKNSMQDYSELLRSYLHIAAIFSPKLYDHDGEYALMRDRLRSRLEKFNEQFPLPPSLLESPLSTSLDHGQSEFFDIPSYRYHAQALLERLGGTGSGDRKSIAMKQHVPWHLRSPLLESILPDAPGSQASERASPSKYTCSTQRPLLSLLREEGLHRAALQSGFTGYIPRWKPSQTVTFSIHGIEFPSLETAMLASEALKKAAEEWNELDMGIKFKWVDKLEDAAFVLGFVGRQGPNGALAEAFFPNEEPKNRLILYEEAFEPKTAPYLKNIFLHELGHVLGLRHEFGLQVDDRGDSNGARIVPRKPDSVMGERFPPMMQASDVEDARCFYHLTTAQFQGQRWPIRNYLALK